MLVACDLDRTLIYSRSAAALDGGTDPARLVPVEYRDGSAVSFMTAAAGAMLTEVAMRSVFVPVTTRTPAQLARVDLPLGRSSSPGRVSFSVAANGGVLLVDGAEDAAWTAHVADRVAQVAPLASAVAALACACAPRWTRSRRIAHGLFCYAVVDRGAMPAGAVGGLAHWAETNGWTVSMQGSKLYLVPQPLTKSAAVAEVTRRAGTCLTLAAGDSLLDIDLLEAADRGVHPGHGEIAESGWSAPHVDALTSVGASAGEDIVAWLADRVG